jgi:hypothetical protein
MRLRALAVVVGCGLGGGCGAAKPVVAPVKQQPDIDPAQASTDAKGLVGEVYQSIGKGDTDGLMTLLSDQLVVFGPRRGDALATRQDALVALGKVVDANNKQPVSSASLDVMPGPGGRSAVAVDTIDTGGQAMSVIAILSNGDDIWLVSAASVADAPAPAELKKALARDAVVPPAIAGAASIDASVSPVVEQWKHGLLAQGEWGAELAGSPGGVFVGPAQGEVVHGKHDLKKAWKRRLDAQTREVAVGDVMASLTPDGRMAWVSAAVARTTATETMPLRVFAVYARHGDAWKLCALQESVAFEAAGAGARYRKVAPPVVAPPAPVVADKPVEVVAVQSKLVKKRVAKKPVVEDAEVASDDAETTKAARKSKWRGKQSGDDDASGDDTAPTRPVKKAAKKVKADDAVADDDAPVAKKRVKRKPKVDDDAAVADDDAAPPKKVKRKPRVVDDDAVADDDAPKPKKVKRKPKPAADDGDGN